MVAVVPDIWSSGLHFLVECQDQVQTSKKGRVGTGDEPQFVQSCEDHTGSSGARCASASPHAPQKKARLTVARMVGKLCMTLVQRS